MTSQGEAKTRRAAARARTNAVANIRYAVGAALEAGAGVDECLTAVRDGFREAARLQTAAAVGRIITARNSAHTEEA